MVSHWMWATVTDGGPRLTQLWFKASCWYSLCYTSPPFTLQNFQHGDAGPTFNRYWISVSLYYVNTSQPTESPVQCWMVDGQSRRRWTSVKPALGWRVVFAGHCVVDQLAADTDHLAIQQTRGIHTMLFQCWPTVFDAGPTLKQHWVNDPRLLGY